MVDNVKISKLAGHSPNNDFLPERKLPNPNPKNALMSIKFGKKAITLTFDATQRIKTSS